MSLGDFLFLAYLKLYKLGQPNNVAMVSEGMEDYLEAIYKLRGEKPVKTKQIANELDVEQPSVSEMFQKLRDKGYISYRKYEGVRLSQEGKEIAEKVIKTHKSIKELLELIGVSEEKAEVDACRIEHQLTDQTTSQLKKLLEDIRENIEDIDFD
ncbi:hypothetical protein C9439_07870 [archaeon SCG-AAA382B04]|nr:hypothetical protein C9439_07870 [archaeon SCG-AAA382B04]